MQPCGGDVKWCHCSTPPTNDTLVPSTCPQQRVDGVVRHLLANAPTGQYGRSNGQKMHCRRIQNPNFEDLDLENCARLAAVGLSVAYFWARHLAKACGTPPA